MAAAPRTAEGLADLADDAAPGATGLHNRSLLALSRIEGALACRVGLPAGVSAIVLARKPG